MIKVKEIVFYKSTTTYVMRAFEADHFFINEYGQLKIYKDDEMIAAFVPGHWSNVVKE